MKALGLFSALAVLATGCGAGDPEAEIRALLAAAEEAAEARDVGFFGDALADGYSDARGNDRDEILRELRGYFIANQRIEILSRIDEIVKTRRLWPRLPSDVLSTDASTSAR